MTVERCPHCRTRFVTGKYSGNDYMHTCNSGNEVLDNEDKFNITQSFFAGAENRLFGTIPNLVHNKRLQRKTSRGNRAITHTSRQRTVHIDFKNGVLGKNPRN